jgi:nucleoside-diphosphate-sugar epimerase
MESLVSIPELIEKNLLIVGGTGFIGGWAVKKAIESGYKVTVLARNLPNPKVQKKNIVYLSADLSSLKEVKNAIEFTKFTHVINLSGEINHSPFNVGGKEVIENHFIGLVNLVASLDREFLKCFIQVGSSDEYGSAHAPQNENHECIPLSSYSFAKLSANNFLKMLSQSENFPAIMIRLFLVFGPHQKLDRFLPQIISSCLLNKKFPVSKGEQLRDFCYVEDVIDGIFLAMESKNLYGNIFNIGSGRPIKIRDLVNKIVEIIGKGEPIFGALPYRDNENMSLYADISKANLLLKWKAKTIFDEGLLKTIKHYRINMKQ